MSAITAKASRKMKKYAVLTREPRCFLGSFDFSWEQRKLGDIASDMVAGGDIDKDLILAEGQYPVIANALTGDGIVGYYDKEYRVNAPAVTVTGRGDVGHAKARLVNFTPVVRLLSVKSEHDVFFLENAINTLKIVIESTGVPQLTVPQLAKYEVAFPRQLDEEEHIGAFFKQLDNLITLHQRKFEKLTNVKKSMLEKMFPQNGSSYPEIRFKGFTDPWEQRKVSELFRVTRGYVLAATQTETTKTDEKPYPVYSSQTKDKGLMGYYKDYLYEDAITWTTDGANAGTVNYRAGKFYCTNVCGVLLSNEVKANQMIAEALNSVAKGYVSYVGNPKLMNNVMADIVIQIPTQAEEREQLSSFFAKLDNLITLHQRKGKAAVSGCSNDANNSKGVCCKARDFGYKCHKKDESK